MQRVLVCAQDSVLAKKVRFLLAREGECDVEILADVPQLERRLAEGDITLLVVSRQLGAHDALDLLGRFDPTLYIPATMVLGGEPRITADFIHLIPDPVDNQVIYRTASELLSRTEDGLELPNDDTDATHMALDAPRRSQTVRNPPALLGASGELSFGDVTGLDEIAGRLDELESEVLSDNLSDAFDIDESQSGFNVHTAKRSSPELPPPSGPLDPARLARFLHQIWSRSTSGALVVNRPDETLTIHFEEGAPVHVESSIPGDPLGRALVGRSRITEAQYADAAKRAIERGLRLGQALVELGFFTTVELGKELGTTAKEQIVACFEARQGTLELDQRRRPASPERPYRLDVAQILAEGLKRHADDAVLQEILGDINTRYFKLRRTIDELRAIYPITDSEAELLRFQGRAYNVSDASEISGVPMRQAHKILALLTVCEELGDFTPGISEFEARIREERQRTKEVELRSEIPQPAASQPSIPPPVPQAPPRQPPPMPMAPPEPPRPPPVAPPPAFNFSSPPPPMPPPMAAPQPAPPPPAATAVPTGDMDIPPMPVPPNGDEGMSPRPLVYAKPLPRGADGAPLETPERTLSREHFQRGVTLLGQGNFASAEEAFRDAVALCSEEHVYLIGLARAIYYNPAYQASGKLPVLKAIVGRAAILAPDDRRVATLRTWVDHAEATTRPV